MSDKYSIDNHKLNDHPRWVADFLEAGDSWEKAKKIYPIYIEISPSGACNHRCTICAVDFMKYRKVFLDTKILKKRLKEMAGLGVKSVMFAGEGEPFLHKNMAYIATSAKKSEIDVAFTTNGSLLVPQISKTIVGCTEWIKVSINAGTPRTYKKVHRVKEAVFSKVVENIKNVVKLRRELGSNCVVGTQMVLLPENQYEVSVLATIMREIGCDYLVIKPYSHHPLSLSERYKNLKYGEDDIKRLKYIAKGFNGYDPRFKLIIRDNNFDNISSEKDYNRCNSVPFLWAYICANGDVYACSMFLGDDRFLLGNINKQTFKEIWEGEKRRKLWQQMKSFDASGCRLGCRMESCNQYLCSRKQPRPHINFI